MKKKYTREQLEFYFTKLMKQLKRVPTEEDMAAAKKLPSVTVYKERFGSWKAVKKRLGKKELNTIACAYCGKTVPFKKRTKQFCSAACNRNHHRREAYQHIPPKHCVICGKPFHIKEVPNFKKRKVCANTLCKQKEHVSMAAKKHNKLTPAMKKKLFALKGNRCRYCDFTEILFFYTPGRHSDKKLVNMLKKRNFDYLVVCPNHKELILKKKMNL